MTNVVSLDDESVVTIDAAEDNNSLACQVRRKIEDYLERKRYQDELGDRLPMAGAAIQKTNKNASKKK